MRKLTITLMAIAAVALLAGTVNAALIVDTTDFDLATPDYSDGYSAGFTTWDGSTNADTTQGWTFYLDLGSVNTISIPYTPGGSVTVGEYEIREGEELVANAFDLGAGTDHTLALRSRSYDVLAGSANVDWVATGSASYLNGYYSQDSGSTWTGFTKGTDFTAAAGTLQVLLARNTGVDTGYEPTIDTVTVEYQAIPEPAALTLLGLVGLGLIVRRRLRRG